MRGRASIGRGQPCRRRRRARANLGPHVIGADAPTGPGTGDITKIDPHFDREFSGCRRCQNPTATIAVGRWFHHRRHRCGRRPHCRGGGGWRRRGHLGAVVNLDEHSAHGHSGPNGHDDAGNSYYRTRGGRLDPALGFERRWVIYAGQSEASATPPGWYGWLHHTTDVAPTMESYVPRAWQLPHLPNMTGTPQAYRPEGSTLASGARPAATGDYQAWTP